MSVFDRHDLSVFTSRMIAASVSNISLEESEKYPLFGRMVVTRDEDIAPTTHAYYERKGLIQRWAEKNKPSIRIGTVHTHRDVLADYITRPAAAQTMPATGSMTVECVFLRGLESRLKIQDARSQARSSKGISELFWEATQSTDELPLARAKPGVAQELQAAGGGPLPEATVARFAQNPKASGEALTKKQVKRQRQKSDKTDDQLADEFAKKQCR